MAGKGKKRERNVTLILRHEKREKIFVAEKRKKKNRKPTKKINS
jgi:hypothetical protein